mmetsp:Transcript_3131/g.11357  ORF Transcript_3131/g.11357 Transcript_3131/m.11357 type:complete len:209 (-) Transcript_3131:146-772(-)
MNPTAGAAAPGAAELPRSGGGGQTHMASGLAAPRARVSGAERRLSCFSISGARWPTKSPRASTPLSLTNKGSSAEGCRAHSRCCRWAPPDRSGASRRRRSRQPSASQCRSAGVSSAGRSKQPSFTSCAAPDQRGSTLPRFSPPRTKRASRSGRLSRIRTLRWSCASDQRLDSSSLKAPSRTASKRCWTRRRGCPCSPPSTRTDGFLRG